MNKQFLNVEHLYNVQRGRCELQANGLLKYLYPINISAEISYIINSFIWKRNLWLSSV